MFKSGKKFFAVIAVLALVALLAATFVGCAELDKLGKPVIQTGNKRASVIIGEDSYLVETNAEYVHDLLVELKESGVIDYEFDMGAYGAFVTKLNGLVGTSDYSRWIGVYVDSDDVDIASPGFDETVAGKTYHMASFGVGSLPVREGVTYLFLQNERKAYFICS